MPSALVKYPDGSEWLVTQCDVMIPIKDAEHLTAGEIGERVLALIPRLQRLAPYSGHWWLSPGLHQLEEVEAHIAEIQQKQRARQAIRAKAPEVRRSLQEDYDRIFVTIGRRDGFACRLCGVSRDLQIDHIIAVINGGTNEMGNLQLLCKKCNCTKGDRDIVP